MNNKKKETYNNKYKEVFTGLGECKQKCTPVIGLGLTPAEILMNREIKSKVPIVNTSLLPKLIDHNKVKNMIENKRRLDKKYYDSSCKRRPDFNEGDKITIREVKKWIREKVERVPG